MYNLYVRNILSHCFTENLFQLASGELVVKIFVERNDIGFSCLHFIAGGLVLTEVVNEGFKIFAYPQVAV
jgi:hypothetical protein